MTVQGPDQPVGPLQQPAADQPAAQSIPAAQAAIAAAAAAQVAPLPTPAALDQPDWAALRCDYIARVKRDPFSLQDIAKELESRHAPAQLIREVSLIAVKENPRVLRYAHESIRANYSIVLEAVSLYGYLLEYAHDSLKKNPDIVLAAVRKDGAALSYAHESLRADYNIVLEAVRRCGWVLEYAHDSLKRNHDIVLAAVRQDGTALRHASEELKADRAIVAAAVREKVKRDPFSLKDIAKELESRHAPAELIREVSLIAVKQDARLLRYAHESLRENYDIVLEAVRLYGYLLEYAHDSLKRNHDIVLAAVKQDARVLRYAHESLRADYSIVLEAVSRCGCVLEYAHDSLKRDPDIVLAAVRQDGYAIGYAAPELKADPGFMLEAVKQNAEILPRAYSELRANPDFLRLLCALFETHSTLTFDAKKRLFMTACGHDTVELKTAIISAAITHLVSVQRTFIEKDLQSLIKELDLIGNFPLMADFLFNPETPSLLASLPDKFKNKDLKIAWALSNLYLNQLDRRLTPAFVQAIDSDKKAFKKGSNLKVLLGFLNQFIDDRIQDSPRRERVLEIMGNIATLFESEKIDILFDRMAILTIYDQCDLSDSIDLASSTPALQDALLDRFIPEDLSPAAAAASPSSSSAPDLRANLKEAIIKSPHPAALIHYLTTLESEGQLARDRPGFELLERIAMGDFQERRHTTCSHPAEAMTPPMRAQWETSAPAVEVAGQSLKAEDSEDWKDLLFCGTSISGSCLNCQGSFEQNAGLLGICLDGKIRMGTVKNADGVIIARCIMRLTTDQAGNTCLFKEKIYPQRYERPSEADAYARQVASALDTLVQRKAEAMGVALYTYASDAATASSGVELSTPPNIAGFDYSDMNSGTAIASFQFSRVHRLYQPS